MSADNGIYILRTKDKQYRVIHTQGFYEINWSFVDMEMCEEFVSTRIIEMFGSSKYTTNCEKAVSIARRLLDKQSICEYGIQVVPIDLTWRDIVHEATIYVEKEIKYVIEKTSFNTDINMKQLIQTRKLIDKELSLLNHT